MLDPRNNPDTEIYQGDECIIDDVVGCGLRAMMRAFISPDLKFVVVESSETLVIFSIDMQEQVFLSRCDEDYAMKSDIRLYGFGCIEKVVGHENGLSLTYEACCSNEDRDFEFHMTKIVCAT